jgi:outer membrane protein OmpA-like peptidoglycan-associated protein
MILRLSARILAVTVFCGMFAPPVTAQTCPDVPGFGPIDALPIYDGACLLGAEDAGFAKFDLPTGPIKGRAPSTTLSLQGQLQRRLYIAPPDVSSFDVFENYRNALADAGFTTLFQCSGRDCGSSNALLGKLVIYPAGRKLTNLGKLSEFGMYIAGDEHFMAASAADGTRHIALYVVQNQDAKIAGMAAGRAAVHLDVLTTADLQTRMIDAAAMAKGISDEGHIAVDNVYFDFGTATLTADAAPALAEMVKLLTENPSLQVYVVGHTDWVGDADANQALSQDRAQSVVASLIAAGIAQSRISAAGVGVYAPRASNTTDAGRSLNRRVELVERPQ